MKRGRYSLATIEHVLDQANARAEELISLRCDPVSWALAQLDAQEALHIHVEFYPFNNRSDQCD